MGTRTGSGSGKSLDLWTAQLGRSIELPRPCACGHLWLEDDSALERAVRREPWRLGERKTPLRLDSVFRACFYGTGFYWVHYSTPRLFAFYSSGEIYLVVG